MVWENPQISNDSLIPMQLEFDLGRLTAFNRYELDASAFTDETLPYEQKTSKIARGSLKPAEIKERFLLQVARAGAQMMCNALFDLPRDSTIDGVFAELPEPVSVLPREKPLPKDVPLTRWERFAKTKGIKNKKRKFQFDEHSGENAVRYGYHGKKRTLAEGKEAPRSKDGLVPENWLIPVSNGRDAFEDQYERASLQKKQRLDKQRMQERRNRQEQAAKESGVHPKLARKLDIERTLAMTKKSTASLGKFDRKIDGDIKLKGIRKKKVTSTVGNVPKETEASKKIAKSILKG